MAVDPAAARSARIEGETFYFCSELCESEFRRKPAGRRRPRRDDPAQRRIAYLSMEIALDPRMPTYSGGLGVLAGDMLRSFADLRVPTVAVTLLARAGYFHQVLDDDGRQREQPERWEPERVLVEEPARVELAIEGRRVVLRAFTHEVVGASGHVVPVLLLDADLPGNDPRDRALTGTLYGGDDRYRLAQEALLGIGGRRMLRALGYAEIERFHMNEGHAALVALELLREAAGNGDARPDFDAMRRRCVFTTHTPVPAGHDRFDWGLVRHVIGEPLHGGLLEMLSGADGLDMTMLALNASHFINGVARKHGAVSDRMFPGRGIGFITNGVHSLTWTSDPMRALFDRHIPEWRDDPAMLRKAVSLPSDELWTAHQAAKGALLHAVHEHTGRELAPDTLVLGFARRATAYKRAHLVVSDVERLRALGRGKLALVFAGKAHPRDEEGKQAIRRIVEIGRTLGRDVPITWLPGYDVELARTIASGADVWLNTPLPPLEASGTSGMKAAHNGVPSLSVLDGWWLEGCVEGVTGWGFGGEHAGRSDADDAAELYAKLESSVLPAFFGGREGWISLMRHAIALNASYFNTHRVVQQYVTNAYLV
jgi:starch phosphorylase